MNVQRAETISTTVRENLDQKGWSWMSTGIDPSNREEVHELFEVMNRIVGLDANIPAETTTLAPRDNSRVLATTREAMSYHTDNVYLNDPCKSVALFCTVQAEIGGSNSLVDGIDVVRSLSSDIRDELKAPQWQWMNPVENGPSSAYSVLDESEENLRWWRMSLVSDSIAKTVLADTIEAAIDTSATKRTVRMLPGDILVTDNTRVVHNREAFSGTRHLYRARFW